MSLLRVVEGCHEKMETLPKDEGEKDRERWMKGHVVEFRSCTPEGVQS